MCFSRIVVFHVFMSVNKSMGQSQRGNYRPYPSAAASYVYKSHVSPHRIGRCFACLYLQGYVLLQNAGRVCGPLMLLSHQCWWALALSNNQWTSPLCSLTSMRCPLSYRSPLCFALQPRKKDNQPMFWCYLGRMQSTVCLGKGLWLDPSLYTVKNKIQVWGVTGWREALGGDLSSKPFSQQIQNGRLLRAISREHQNINGDGDPTTSAVEQPKLILSSYMWSSAPSHPGGLAGLFPNLAGLFPSSWY